jgi:hypothetical protein
MDVSASYPGSFTAERRLSGNHSLEGWMDSSFWERGNWFFKIFTSITGFKTLSYLLFVQPSNRLVSIPKASKGYGRYPGSKYTHYRQTSDNKVRELATVCLPWQQWTETSVWFDTVGVSGFHSCVVVDLWQSLSKLRLILSECVLVWSRQQLMVLASRQRTCSHGTVCEGVFS